MKKKWILGKSFGLLFVLLLLSACSLVDDEPRYIKDVTFLIVDQHNKPVANSWIGIDQDSTDEGREIGTYLGETDENGIIERSPNEVREYQIAYYQGSFTITEEDEGATITVVITIEEDQE